MRAILCVTILLGLNSYANGNTPPKVFISKDVCPGEFCKFGTWKVKRKINLYKKINGEKQTLA